MVSAAADVERDLGTVRASAAGRDARGVREDSDHVLQALDRLDARLDEVFVNARLERLQFLRAVRSNRR